MKNSEKFNRAFLYFKESYAYKMGGTQTVILPNGKSKFFDDREYYSGRGAKYNSNIRHDERGEIKVSRKEYSAFLAKLREEKARREQNIKEQAARAKRIEAAKEKGLYSLSEKHPNDFLVELTPDESHNQYFDAERLARTLNIKVEDVELLNSKGKTYVFARQIGTGKIFRLYHNSLSCNDLTIWVTEVSEETLKKFNHAEWASAPYAHLVGQTANKNHFVC